MGGAISCKEKTAEGREVEIIKRTSQVKVCKAQIVEYARERCGERTRRMVCVVKTSRCVFKRHRIWLAMVD
jgi:hypothetical protein